MSGFALDKTLKETFTPEDWDFPSFNGELKVFHGWWVLAMYWAMILALAFIVLGTNVWNLYDATYIINVYIFSIIRCAPLGIDLCFFYGVFLNFLSIWWYHISHGRIGLLGYLKLIGWKWLQITPLYYITMFGFWFIGPLLTSSPSWY